MSTKDMSINSIKVIYIISERSILEYASTIRTSHYNLHILNIERGHHMFLKNVVFKLST